MNSVVKIFISSTFKDLEEERKIIRTKIIPVLQSYANKYAVSIIPIDLSWGITDTESLSKKVLERCLLEIDNSRPFFIGIIGVKYGWIPKETDLSTNTFALYPCVRKWLNLQKSITEMEMLYGALDSEKFVDAAFYISDNIIDSVPLIDLIKRIETDGRFPTHRFSREDEFCKMVLSDFKTFLDRHYSKTEPASQHIILQREPINYNSINERANYIETYMKLHGKHCSSNHLNRLLSCRLSNDPDSLSKILQILILYATFDTIDFWIERIVKFENKSNLYEAIIELFVGEFGYNAIKKALGFMISVKTPVKCFELSNMSGSSEYLIRSLSMVFQKTIEKKPDYFYCDEELFRNIVKRYFYIDNEYENLISTYYTLNEYVNMTYHKSWQDCESEIFDLENMAGYYEIVENYRQAAWHLDEASSLRYEYGEKFGFEELTDGDTRPISFTKNDYISSLITCAELYMKSESKEDVKRTMGHIEKYINFLSDIDLKRISDIYVWLKDYNEYK